MGSAKHTCGRPFTTFLFGRSILAFWYYFPVNLHLFWHIWHRHRMYPWFLQYFLVKLHLLVLVFNYNTVWKFCFPSSFQNLGIRCVKKKEVKEAIISRIRAGINPFNGKYVWQNYFYYLDIDLFVQVSSVCILNLCFKSCLKFCVHFSACWWIPVSKEGRRFKTFHSVGGKNSLTRLSGICGKGHCFL